MSLLRTSASCHATIGCFNVVKLLQPNNLIPLCRYALPHPLRVRVVHVSSILASSRGALGHPDQHPTPDFCRNYKSHEQPYSLKPPIVILKH